MVKKYVKFSSLKCCISIVLLLSVAIIHNAGAAAKSFKKDADKVTFRWDKGQMKIKVCAAGIKEVKCTISDSFLSKELLVVNSNLSKIIPFGVYENKGLVTVTPANTKKFYLSKFTWFNFLTGETVTGGKKIEADFPINFFSLHIESGSILPWRPDIEAATNKTSKPAERCIYPGANSIFIVCADETEN